jgi:hypothetical protein
VRVHTLFLFALTRIGGDLALITFLTSKVGKLKCRTYYPKGSLERVLEIPAVQFTKLAHAKYRHWVLEIFAALEWIHQIGVLHGDIKPEVNSSNLLQLILLEYLRHGVVFFIYR